MLDTVKLLLEDYTVSPDNRLTVQPSSYIEGTGEKLSEYPLWRKGGGSVYGSKAYFNNPHLNLSIQPFKGSGVQAFLHFSVPKVYHGDNYFSVGREGTQAVLKIIEAELREAGVRTDIQEASLSRVDTFNNLISEEPFLSYAPVFSLLSGSRQQRRDYGSTFLWENTQQELCVYDKCKEAENRGILAGTYPAQSMRMEYRLLNKRKIDKTLGFCTVKELPERWDTVKEKHLSAWRKLFSYEVEEVEIMASRQVSGELKYYKEKYGRNYLDYYLRAVGSLTLATVAGVDIVRLALESLESERTKVWRAVKRLDQAKAELELIREEPSSKKTLSTLYLELKEKIYLN